MTDSSRSQTSMSKNPQTDLSIPAPLKFVIANIKNIVSLTLTAENFPLWSSQVLKLLKANGYDGFLHGTNQRPPQFLLDNSGNTNPNPHYNQWQLIDQNLFAALAATISTSILPYILNLPSMAAIWETLVDQISAAGAQLDSEDIILHILNGLPSTYYQAFKTSIRTRAGALPLDDLYSLLISEEINLTTKLSRDRPNPHRALYFYRGCGRNSSYRGLGCSSPSSRPSSYDPRSAPSSYSRKPINCQICHMPRHQAADSCPHLNLAVSPPTRPPPRAFLAHNHNIEPNWVLDTGATAHVTSNYSSLQHAEPYNSTDSVSVGNGTSLPITHNGQGLLPTPSRKLYLKNLHHVPNISHNLLSVHSLATTITEVIWLRSLLTELSAPPSTPTELHCDNTSALAIASNPILHARTKHVEIDFHFVRDHLTDQTITLHHIRTQHQKADIFTKPHTTARFNFLCDNLTIRQPDAEIDRGNNTINRNIPESTQNQHLCTIRLY